jgi:hypothetical protein
MIVGAGEHDPERLAMGLASREIESGQWYQPGRWQWVSACAVATCFSVDAMSWAAMVFSLRLNEIGFQS